MHRGFTKLFNTIVTSTIWQEDDKTRIVWITMLAIADAFGNVFAAIPGLASVANVSIEATDKAIKNLLAPDPYSRTKDRDGIRIEPIDGGWHILNYVKYRQMLDEEERKEYKARWIANRRAVDKSRQPSTARRLKSTVSTQAEAEAEAEAEKKKEASGKPRPTFDVENWLNELEKDETYKGLNIRNEYGKCRNWCSVRGFTVSKKRFINWINKDRPLPELNGLMPPEHKMSAFEITKRIEAIEERLGQTVFNKEKHKDEREKLQKRRRELKEQLRT